MPSNESSSMQALSQTEMALIRFFRCMDSEEEISILSYALATLAKRLSLDLYRLDSNVINETLDWPIEVRLLHAFPLSWPEQNLVELDAVGDCGYWLEAFFDGRTVDLFFLTLDCEGVLNETANELSEDYIKAVDEAGNYAGECEFEGDEKAFQEAIAHDFVRAIKFWHEQVLSNLEQQTNS